VPGTGPVYQPPPRFSPETRFEKGVLAMKRAVGLDKTVLKDARRRRPLLPASSGSYLIVLDMDRLLYETSGSLRPGVVTALRALSFEGCEIVLLTSKDKAAATAAAARLGTGSETQIVYNFMTWFEERTDGDRLMYKRPVLLAGQQAARSDSLEHVLIFEGQVDASRGFRQNTIVVDTSAEGTSEGDYFMQSIVMTVLKLKRQMLSVPEFLASQALEFLRKEHRQPVRGRIMQRHGAHIPVEAMFVPVLYPSSALAAEADFSGRKKSVSPDRTRRPSSSSGVRFYLSCGEQDAPVGLEKYDDCFLGDPVPLNEP